MNFTKAAAQSSVTSVFLHCEGDHRPGAPLQQDYAKDVWDTSRKIRRLSLQNAARQIPRLQRTQSQDCQWARQQSPGHKVEGRLVPTFSSTLSLHPRSYAPTCSLRNQCAWTAQTVDVQ